MTISILGCGWLGLPLGEALAKAGHRVKGSTTTPTKCAAIRAAGITPFVIRVEEEVRGEDLNDFFDTDLLILNIPPGRRNPQVEEYHPRQIRAVIQYMTEAEVPHLIFISSTGVYPDLNRVVTEADSTDATRPSAAALVIAERFIQLQTAFQTTILRLSGLVGGDRKAGRFLAGRQQLPNGDAPVNLVHRADCIAVIQLIVAKQKWGSIYNVCADEHPKKRDFYTTQAYKEQLTPPSFQDNTSDISYKIVSNQKLKQELGYSFIHPDPMMF